MHIGEIALPELPIYIGDRLNKKSRLRSALGASVINEVNLVKGVK